MHISLNMLEEVHLFFMSCMNKTASHICRQSNKEHKQTSHQQYNQVNPKGMYRKPEVVKNQSNTER